MIELAALFLPLASYHVERNGQNEFNPGIVAEFRLPESRSDLGVAIGAYRNSNDRTTVFTQAVWTPLVRPTPAGTLRAGLSLGVGTGYSSPVVGGLFLALGHAHFTLIPPVGGSDRVAGGVVAFALRFDM